MLLTTCMEEAGLDPRDYRNAVEVGHIILDNCPPAKCAAWIPIMIKDMQAARSVNTEKCDSIPIIQLMLVLPEDKLIWAWKAFIGAAIT